MSEIATQDFAKAPSTAAGAWLVLASAVTWSFGGLLSRVAGVGDPWVVVSWRAGIAALFILGFMLWRDGRKDTLALAASMGLPGLAVAACFALAMTSFIVALNHTTVANILLIQSSVPLIAALMSWLLFAEKAGAPTWAAIAAVIAGVGVMVSESFGGGGSLLGNGLALVIALAFASATVITRRHAQIRMTPAVLAGASIASTLAVAIGLAQGSNFALGAWQFAAIAAFGVSLGLGLALFTLGARAIPSAYAALLGTTEPILGPLWVWLALGETPSPRAAAGGALVLAALLAYLAWQLREQRREKRAMPAAI